MRSIFIVCLFFSAKMLFAQDQDSTSIIDSQINYQHDLSEVVVTGQLKETTIDKSIHSVKVVEQKKLNSGIYNNLGALLKTSPNINLAQDNVLGSSISMQGISGRNVKVLIDEVPIIGRLDGNIDLSQISLLNIERVEIVEGPMSTIYGSDALAGTINIVTKDSFSHNYILNTYYESIGKYNLDLQVNSQIRSNQFSYQFGRKYFNGWSEGQEFTLLPNNQLADTNRVKQWKPKEQYFNKLTYRFKMHKLSISSYVELFNEKLTSLGMPTAPYYEHAFDEFYRTTRINIGSEAKYKNAKDETRILASYNNYVRSKETIYKDLTDLSQTVVNSSGAQDTSVFDAILTKIVYSNYKIQNWKYQFGADLQFYTAQGERILNNDKEQSNLASFFTIEHKLNDIISLRQSNRIIYNSDYSAPFVHSGNVLFNFNNYQIRTSYGKGFRAPDFKELYLNFVDINHNIIGNENLIAETSINYNLHNTLKGKIYEVNFIADFGAFYNKIENKINLYEDPDFDGRYSYFNIDKFTSKGVNSNIKFLYSKAEVIIGASHIGTLSEIGGENNNLGYWLFNTNYNLSSYIEINKNTSINLFYKYTGKSPYFSSEINGITQKFSEAYNLLDMSLKRDFINQRINITLGAKNIFDVTNIKSDQNSSAVHSSGNNLVSVGYGRSFFTKITLRL